jgi:hypothetical protein
MLVPLAQRQGDGAYWDGSMIFPAPGDWTLRVLFGNQPTPNPRYSAVADAINNAGNRCTGVERDVRVVSTNAEVGSTKSTEATPGPKKIMAEERGVQAFGTQRAWVMPVVAVLLMIGLAALLARRLHRRN